MKKIILACWLSACLATAASAQQLHDSSMATNGHFHRYGRQHSRDLSRQLDLTQTQRAQLKSLNQDYHQGLRELDRNENITVREMRDRKAALRKEHRNAFQQLLTPDQKTRMQEFSSKRQLQSQAMASRKMDKMKTVLSLTDEQTTKIKDLNQEFRAGMMKLREDQSMGRTEKKDQMHSLSEQHKEQISRMLTPEQQNKLTQWRSQRVDRELSR